MSEEEKKAIKFMRQWHNYAEIKTLLDLIEKQNNRLEQLEKENKELTILSKALTEDNKGLFKEMCRLKSEFENYIPKSVIREELRTLKNMLPTALHETSRAVFNGEIALLERILGEE